MISIKEEIYWDKNKELQKEKRIRIPPKQKNKT